MREITDAIDAVQELAEKASELETENARNQQLLHNIREHAIQAVLVINTPEEAEQRAAALIKFILAKVS